MSRLSRTVHYRTIPALGLALALALTGLARAQAPAPAADPDAVLVEELVVTARLPGPAFWRVEDADSTVWILGVPSLAPRRMVWDQNLFRRRLEGAHTVILPARGIRVRLAGAPAAAVAYLRLRSSRPYETRLPEPERARFARAREGLGQPAARYGVTHPLAAALLLITDYRERHGLTDQDPAKLIRLLATQAGVPVISPVYDLGPLLNQVARAAPSGSEACLEAALQEAEAGPAATLAAARAWAEGDVAGALTGERTYERCLAAVPGAAAFDARTKADQARLITQALQRPGHAVAVAPLRPLLSQDGILARLRAQGLAVRTPGDADR